MPNTEPATSQDVVGQETARQPDADARRRAGLRATSLGICLMLIAQLILGLGVNWYVYVPAAGQGHGLGTALGRALTNPPATPAAHAALGTLLLIAAVNVLTRAIQARPKPAIAASATGLAAIAAPAVRGVIRQRQARWGLHGHGGPHRRSALVLPGQPVRRAPASDRSRPGRQ